jgi:hypothetical protein
MKIKPKKQNIFIIVNNQSSIYAENILKLAECLMKKIIIIMHFSTLEFLWKEILIFISVHNDQSNSNLIKTRTVLPGLTSLPPPSHGAYRVVKNRQIKISITSLNVEICQ